MLRLEESSFQSLIIHRVGNRSLEEGLQLSDSPVDATDPALHAVLQQYFISAITGDEMFHFKNEVSLDQNEIYHLARLIFADPTTLTEHSRSIAAHLYEQSTHPRIRAGELYVVVFRDVVVEDEVTDAIGIFKSESRETFLQVDLAGHMASIGHQEGIPARKPDKACLIFNLDADRGYRVCISDHLNRSTEAGFWKDDFLCLSPIGNDFYQTNQFMNLTKQFVTKQYAEEFEAGKADQIDLLNRSVDYFRQNEVFDQSAFTEAVFEDSDVRSSFTRFEEQYRQDHDIDLDETFTISIPAVKKQSRVFKSVIKLDRNFHIYVHGDKSLIEQGVDEHGRKYYKLYYQEEG